MIKYKKYISMALSLSILFGGSLISPSNTYASVKENVQIQKFQQDFDKQISNIEQKYIIQNNDGTFSLSKAIYSEYDKEVVSFLEKNMSEINEYITSGDLKFKIFNENGHKVIKNTFNNLTENKITNESSILKSKTSGVGRIVSDYKYCSGYEWHAWGYRTNVSKKGSELLKNEYTYILSVAGGMVTLATICGGGAAAAAVGLFAGLTIGEAVKECAQGVSRGKGVKVTGLGKPSTGAVITVYSK